MKEIKPDIENADEKTRRMGIAVANWLCGTLEGIARDNADMALAEALDSWLRRQKRNGETLYTGSIVCAACGHRWECLVLSTGTGNVACPHCGAVQNHSPANQRTNCTKPENMEALENVRKDVGDVVSRIETFNQIIKNRHELDVGTW
jgi:DNA-directed RNA polymerase subunit RPC12/RpoP